MPHIFDTAPHWTKLPVDSTLGLTTCAAFCDANGIFSGTGMLKLELYFGEEEEVVVSQICEVEQMVGDDCAAGANKKRKRKPLCFICALSGCTKVQLVCSQMF